jgi:hypothetical protein
MSTLKRLVYVMVPPNTEYVKKRTMDIVHCGAKKRFPSSKDHRQYVEINQFTLFCNTGNFNGNTLKTIFFLLRDTLI